MARFVLDTNTVSQILRRNATALARLGEAAAGDNDLYMCPVVFYELWRGLAYRDAHRQLEDLDAFTRTLQWVDYDRPMWADAARLWADRRREGRPHDDADLLIAAFTRRLRATLVTNNTGARWDGRAGSQGGDHIADRIRNVLGAGKQWTTGGGEHPDDDGSECRGPVKLAITPRRGAGSPSDCRNLQQRRGENTTMVPSRRRALPLRKRA